MILSKGSCVLGPLKVLGLAFSQKGPGSWLLIGSWVLCLLRVVDHGPLCKVLGPRSSQDPVSSVSGMREFCFNLEINPQCHTLSKAFDISRETLLALKPISKDM